MTFVYHRREYTEVLVMFQNADAVPQMQKNSNPWDHFLLLDDIRRTSISGYSVTPLVRFGKVWS